MCSVLGWPHWLQGWRHRPDRWLLGPFMRRLTPQVVVQAGRPHCHLSGPAAQERVKATSKRAHAHTSLPPLRGQRAGTTQKSHVISFGQFSLAP